MLLNTFAFLPTTTRSALVVYAFSRSVFKWAFFDSKSKLRPSATNSASDCSVCAANASSERAAIADSSSGIGCVRSWGSGWKVGSNSINKKHNSTAAANGVEGFSKIHIDNALALASHTVTHEHTHATHVQWSSCLDCATALSAMADFSIQQQRIGKPPLPIFDTVDLENAAVSAASAAQIAARVSVATVAWLLLFLLPLLLLSLRLFYVAI